MTTTTPTPEPLRVGLVGYGLGGAVFHAPFIATTPGLRLAAVVTRDATRAAAARETHPSAAMVADLDALLAPALGIDLVVISTPNRTHASLARRAIEAGRHVVVDKPLVPTVAEARALVTLARERGVVLSPYMNRRWDGDIQTARALLDAGTLGAPLRFTSRIERWRPATTGSWRERGGSEEAGGILYDLGSHLIDQALLLFGPVQTVYAELETRRAGTDADDEAFLALHHASGVRSHLLMSALAAIEGPRLHLLGTSGGYRKFGPDVQEAALRAGETPGTAEWGCEPEARWGIAGIGSEARPVPTIRGDYGAFYRGMERAMRGAAPPPVDPLDAIAGLEIIAAARESAARSVVVRMPA